MLHTSCARSRLHKEPLQRGVTLEQTQNTCRKWADAVVELGAYSVLDIRLGWQMLSREQPLGVERCNTIRLAHTVTQLLYLEAKARQLSRAHSASWNTWVRAWIRAQLRYVVAWCVAPSESMLIPQELLAVDNHIVAFHASLWEARIHIKQRSEYA